MNPCKVVIYKFTVTIMSFQLEGSFYFHMAVFFSPVWL